MHMKFHAIILQQLRRSPAIVIKWSHAKPWKRTVVSQFSLECRRWLSNSQDTPPLSKNLNNQVPLPLPSYYLGLQQSNNLDYQTMAKPETTPIPVNGTLIPESSTTTVADTTILELLLKDKCFSGHQYIYKHYSHETKCPMKFSAFVPTQVAPDEKFHVIFFLSGVMCNEQNFIFKTGFQRYASEHRIILVGSDTSPRNCDIPGDRDSWVFGRSAGWYLDALMEPWSNNYRMYSYVTKELVEAVSRNLPTTGKFGACGHSMGGNGAIVCALRNPNLFQSLSVLAPSCNPTSWGDKIIYTPFLGDENKELWKQYDAFHVAKAYEGPKRKILVDCGLEDEYLHLLLPDKLVEAAEGKSCLEVELNMREGFNHSYFFVATFIEDHIKFHKEALAQLST